MTANGFSATIGWRDRQSTTSQKNGKILAESGEGGGVEPSGDLPPREVRDSPRVDGGKAVSEMYVGEFNVVHSIDYQDMVDAISSSMDLDADEFILRTETHKGDFPFLVRLTIPSASEPPTLEQYLSIARKLRAILLTDDVAVGELWDDGYSLISPDGFTAVVRAEENALEEGNIVLEPDSRALYQAASARLNDLAAD